MSTTPAVWKPYCAGSAPVISVRLLANRSAMRLAEDRQPLGQLHAVQPVLHVGVLAAQVDLAEAVLRHAGRLQQHLVKRRVFALRNVLQSLRREDVARRAEARLDLLARHIQPLRNHVDVDRSRCCPGLGLRHGRSSGWQTDKPWTGHAGHEHASVGVLSKCREIKLNRML